MDYPFATSNHILPKNNTFQWSSKKLSTFYVPLHKTQNYKKKKVK